MQSTVDYSIRKNEMKMLKTFKLHNIKHSANDK